MSRFGDYDDCDAQPSHWFEGSLARAITSKPGQRNLRELAEAMLTMPERKLAYGYLATSAGMACAVGVFAKHRGIDLSKWVDDNDDYNAEITIQVGREAGLAKVLAIQLAWLNDEKFHDRISDEARWEGVYRWVCSKIHWNLPVPA